MLDYHQAVNVYYTNMDEKRDQLAIRGGCHMEDATWDGSPISRPGWVFQLCPFLLILCQHSPLTAHEAPRNRWPDECPHCGLWAVHNATPIRPLFLKPLTWSPHRDRFHRAARGRERARSPQGDALYTVCNVEAPLSLWWMGLPQPCALLKFTP